eukprot:10874734-Lingulodinium_polyedra.AAC.1
MSQHGSVRRWTPMRLPPAAVSIRAAVMPETGPLSRSAACPTASWRWPGRPSPSASTSVGRLLSARASSWIRSRSS